MLCGWEILSAAVGVQVIPGKLIFSKKISYNSFGHGKQAYWLARI
jgi:hypothetical protein